ncbi:MAG: serine/threonine protein kinase [bacterium]|nr:serine/threonine protein kinase [bacterium]
MAQSDSSDAIRLPSADEEQDANSRNGQDTSKEAMEESDEIGRIADEFVNAYRAGANPSIEDFAARYPQHAKDIRDLLPTLVLMESAKSEKSYGASRSRQFFIPIQQLSDTLRDFRFIREVGRGGMGIVYEAEQKSLGRKVALKVLPPQLNDSPMQRDRFEREARVAAQLHHTNIVPVFGVGQKGDFSYYVMQFIEGASLERVIRVLQNMADESFVSFNGPESIASLECDSSTSAIARMLLSGEVDDPVQRGMLDSSGTTGDSNPLAEVSNGLSGRRRPPPFAGRGTEFYWHRVAILGEQVAEALHYAHEQNVTHRDIKPSNLVLDLQGSVWVTDFGLAKIQEQENLTRSGDVLGTMRYLAPEALEGKASPLSDVYSLGLTLYELIALRPA